MAGLFGFFQSNTQMRHLTLFRQFHLFLSFGNPRPCFIADMIMAIRATNAFLVVRAGHIFFRHRMTAGETLLVVSLH